MAKILNTSFNFKDLQFGDILTNKDGQKYFVPGITGNGVIKQDGKFTVLNDDLTNPHSSKDGGLDIVTVERIMAQPDIELLSEAVGKVMLGKRTKWPTQIIWQRVSPAVAAAKAKLDAADAAAQKAAAAAAAARAELARLSR